MVSYHNYVLLKILSICLGRPCTTRNCAKQDNLANNSSQYQLKHNIRTANTFQYVSCCIYLRCLHFVLLFLMHVIFLFIYCLYFVCLLLLPFSSVFNNTSIKRISDKYETNDENILYRYELTFPCHRHFNFPLV